MSLIPANPTDSLSIREAFYDAIRKALQNLKEAGKMTEDQVSDFYEHLNDNYPKSHDWDASDFDGSNYDGGVMDEDDWAIIRSVDERQIISQIHFYRGELDYLRNTYGN